MNIDDIVLLLEEEYSRMAEVYDKNVVPRFTPMAKRVLDMADIEPGERVIDIGCGTGNLALQAARRVSADNGEVVAVDLSSGAIELAIRKAEETGTRNVRFEMMDAQNIEYRSKSFDVALSSFGMPVFGHGQVFAEARRLLRNGGRLVFCEWSEKQDSVSKAFLELLKKYAVKDPPEELRRLREAIRFIRKSKEREDLVSSETMMRKLKDVPFQDVAVTTKIHKAIFPTVDDYVSFSTSWGHTERELRAMDDPTRDAFREELERRVASHMTSDGLTVPWEIHYYRGTR